VTVRLFMDHHVRSAITDGLRSRGVDVLTAYEDRAHRLADELLLERAIQLDRALVTEDADLLRIAEMWLAIGREFSGVVYTHRLRLTIGEAVQDLELIAKLNEPKDMYNRVEYLPL